MIKTQGFLATFRIDEELWGKFKDIAKNKQTSASALIIQYIQGVVSSGGADNPPAIPQNIDNSPHSYIQDIDNRIDEKIRQSIQNINTPSIQNIEDLIDARIGGSVHAGHIKDAIASSYVAATGQMNGLLGELQDLKSQLQELQLIPPAPVSEQLTTDNGQLTEDVDRLDSDFASDTQVIPDPTRNQIENIRTTLKRRGIHSITNEKIRNAFNAAGWDGDNLKEIRQAIIDSLSPPK